MFPIDKYNVDRSLRKIWLEFTVNNPHSIILKKSVAYLDRKQTVDAKPEKRLPNVIKSLIDKPEVGEAKKIDIMSSYAYYKVLECSKESSYEEVKKNYRKLVLRYHPDKTDSSENRTTDKFRQIEEAWQILRDPESRKKYDAECRQAQLEMQSVLIFATITVDEMEVTVDDDTLSYQCRCGSYYLANREDLLKRNCSLHIPCQECTFVLIVQT